MEAVYSPQMSEVTLLLEAASRGEGSAPEELLPLVYDELRSLAAARMAREVAVQTLQPTALVHEAWLRLVGSPERTWSNRVHFFRVAAQVMRRILVDKAREKSSLRRGGNRERVDIEQLDLVAVDSDDRILRIDEALNRLEIEDPESARIVTLKFFGGLTNKEVASDLNVTERTVERQWAYAKAALIRLVQEGS